LKKGVLELCALALLSRGESYAYEIAGKLAERVGMGEGTIYPLMRRLQGEGLVDTYLVESSSGPPRKYYRLTKAGKAAYERQKSAWIEFSRAVNAVCKESSSDTKDIRRRSA
jgi:PadR family transcriptional regulator PadR